MKARLIVVLLFAFVLVWSVLASAQEKASGIPDRDKQKVEMKIDKSKVSPELLPILEAEEAAVKQINELKQQIETTDPARVAELQKKIEEIKWNTEIQILKIRLGIAQKRNDTRNVEQIQKALWHLENPPQIVEDKASRITRETSIKEQEAKERRAK
jgi:hypothetical protein